MTNDHCHTYGHKRPTLHFTMLANPTFHNAGQPYIWNHTLSRAGMNGITSTKTSKWYTLCMLRAQHSIKVLGFRSREVKFRLGFRPNYHCLCASDPCLRTTFQPCTAHVVYATMYSSRTPNFRNICRIPHLLRTPKHILLSSSHEPRRAFSPGQH